MNRNLQYGVGLEVEEPEEVNIEELVKEYEALPENGRLARRTQY